MGLILQDIGLKNPWGSRVRGSPYPQKLWQIRGWVHPVQCPLPHPPPLGRLSPRLCPELLLTRGHMQ